MTAETGCSLHGKNQSLITRTLNMVKETCKWQPSSQSFKGKLTGIVRTPFFLGGASRVVIDCSSIFPASFTKVVCQVVHVRRGEFRRFMKPRIMLFRNFRIPQQLFLNFFGSWKRLLCILMSYCYVIIFHDICVSDLEYTYYM